MILKILALVVYKAIIMKFALFVHFEQEIVNVFTIFNLHLLLFLLLLIPLEKQLKEFLSTNLKVRFDINDKSFALRQRFVISSRFVSHTRATGIRKQPAFNSTLL